MSPRNLEHRLHNLERGLAPIRAIAERIARWDAFIEGHPLCLEFERVANERWPNGHPDNAEEILADPTIQRVVAAMRDAFSDAEEAAGFPRLRHDEAINGRRAP